MSEIAGAAYEVFALRYGTRESQRSAEYFRYDLYEVPDAPQRMDYYFWLVRNAERTVLVDCGFDRERGALKHRTQTTSPEELLARVGVSPEDVDHVVVSHMHYDHIGNIGAFPRATVSVMRDEYEFWTGPIGHKPLMESVVLPEERGIMERLRADGRVRLLDRREEVAPGITAIRVGGHTPGQAIVQVVASTGTIVLASDAIHYYDELTHDWPFRLFDGLGDSYRAFDVLRELEASGATLIAGHDPRVTELFTEIAPDCFDLTAPLSTVRPTERH
ncbi:N-acyl homoserine lactonase family protein [Microbacterium sp. X-17]|uniref:N-acyl homoserine lactonase family protein n=1 Tax=Microbacterium sp. X-17 TaxID=3144404 RepID=UPI0031F54AE4